MSEYTPGPWEWHEDVDELRPVGSDGGDYVLMIRDKHCDPYLDISEADATLIRHAPEMYELLKRVAGLIWTRRDDKWDKRIDEIIAEVEDNA